MIKKLIDETGNKYGLLTVIKRSDKTKAATAYWECICDCGKYHVVAGGHLRTGNTKSCGCKLIISTSKTIKHGLSKHPFKQIFNDARRRCTNSKCQNWERYGARGIEFRLGTIQEFVSRMESTWFAGASLGRKDNDGHYEYGNIRWETKMQQACNTSTNVFLSFGGRTMIIAEWAREIGISAKALGYRVKNWGVDRAISEPIKARQHQS